MLLSNLIIYLYISSFQTVAVASKRYFFLLQTLALHLKFALTNDNFGFFLTSLSNDRGKRLLVKRKSAFVFVKVEI